MKNLQFLLLFAFVAFIEASPLSSSKPSFFTSPECSEGAVFWCDNIKNARKCNAVDFCISAIWELHRVKSDSGIICDDCKEWVGKAREFIENEDKSGDVIKSLKWTCDLIPLDTLKKTCDDIVDDNIPAILKMLESQMDPDAVCSALDICNNAAIDKALLDRSEIKGKLLPFTCSQCHHISSIVEKKFRSQDDVLEKLLTFCGEMSSFSDSCSSIVMMNIDEIHKAMLKNVNKNSLCEASGACAHHQLVKEGITDIVPFKVDANPNIPCELCEQLVLHLRELIIANTTEIEFKNICVGFCHQMGSFSKECVELADQYYDILYNFLVEHLNASKACALINICPAKLEGSEKLAIPFMPLVSSDLHPMPDQTLIEVHTVSKDSSIQGGSWCTTCDYFIHYLQQELSKQKTEEEIVALMKKTCLKLPQKIQGECSAMVELYGDALLAIIDQDIDPTLICAKLKLCTSSSKHIVMPEVTASEQPTCQFCLFAMQDVFDVIKSDKTKKNVENVLENLCNHLSDKLVGQCTEFVKDYSDQVVEMILADFSPEDVCTFLKLCSNDKPKYRSVEIIGSDGFDDDKESQKTISNPQCELCKEVVKIVEQRVINKKSKDEIRRELEKSCSRLKKFSAKCTQFVDKYSDQIVDLIEKELEPEEVCRDLVFCVTADEPDFQDYDSGLDILLMAEKEPDQAIKAQPQCVMCEFMMMKLESELNDTKTDAAIKKAVRNVCSTMPSTVAKSCNKFVDYYFDMIIVFVETMEPSAVCASMKLCPAKAVDYDRMMIDSIQQNLYECAVCKGFVEGLDTIVEDPYTDANLENLEEKLCEDMAGKYRTKCHDIAKTYGLAIINLMKTLTGSDEICYKLQLCATAGEGEPTGMLKLT